ncbi:hypothetical protein Cni_G27234 [Canna indica]|uniref:Uncharacterized protein n=1 Tax=Canna indica TaxID=4628 RepID=A0AAQ3L0U5_9LILI|nr:hypothetical protein Cni_G27234 [Canna indica]
MVTELSRLDLVRRLVGCCGTTTVDGLIFQLLSLIELKFDTCRKMSKEYRETARQRFIITHNLDELMREAGRQKQRPGPSDEDEDINPGENDEVIDDDLYS